MIAFAALLERLAFTQGRNAKIALLRRYFATTPDPDRGFGLAAVAGELVFAAAKPALIRDLAAARTDPALFAWSADYVGDLAETVALMWPEAPTGAAPPTLGAVVATLAAGARATLPAIVAGWLDASDASVRLALLKLITGGLRVGASARLARLALADLSDGRIGPDDIEEVWHALAPPYAALFAWIEGHGPRRTRRMRRCIARRCWRTRWQRKTSQRSTLPPCARNGSGTASACNWSQPQAGGGSIRAAPRTFPQPSRRSLRR